jgi:anaerobic selenocysteine-containing dehydrogenase
MFTTPAIDPVPLAGLLGFDGGFARWRSRVSGKPEFGGELPMSAFAEEIETAGPGQIRALVTSAGNPVLSAPGGSRIERALGGLDFMVSIDPYINETTRQAHVILPPTSPLERAHYDVALNAFAVRNVAKYSPALFPRAATARHDWEICAELWTRLGADRLARGPGAAIAERMGLPRLARKVVDALVSRLGPEGILEAGLRIGPYGIGGRLADGLQRRIGSRSARLYGEERARGLALGGRGGLSLGALRAQPHGVDLGALVPRLPARLGTADKRVQLAPRAYLDDLPRLARKYGGDGTGAAVNLGLVLIGRRQLRSNNSWMHNSARLVKGPPRCTVLVHPDDAAARGLADGARARVSTARGAIELPVEISDEVMRGVVSVPHGWGHGRGGSRLRVANTVPGASVNDILDPAVIDELSGTSALTGQAVEVVPA